MKLKKVETETLQQLDNELNTTVHMNTYESLAGLIYESDNAEDENFYDYEGKVLELVSIPVQGKKERTTYVVYRSNDTVAMMGTKKECQDLYESIESAMYEYSYYIAKLKDCPDAIKRRIKKYIKG